MKIFEIEFFAKKIFYQSNNRQVFIKEDELLYP